MGRLVRGDLLTTPSARRVCGENLAPQAPVGGLDNPQALMRLHDDDIRRHGRVGRAGGEFGPGAQGLLTRPGHGRRSLWRFEPSERIVLGVRGEAQRRDGDPRQER